MVWYSHLFQNFPQFAIIYTIKGSGMLNKADAFLELSCFIDYPTDAGSLISGSYAFSKSSLNIWKFMFMYSSLSITFLVCEMSAIVQ